MPRWIGSPCSVNWPIVSSIQEVVQGAESSFRPLDDSAGNIALSASRRSERLTMRAPEHRRRAVASGSTASTSANQGNIAVDRSFRRNSAVERDARTPQLTHPAAHGFRWMARADSCTRPACRISRPSHSGTSSSTRCRLYRTGELHGVRQQRFTNACFSDTGQARS